MQVLRLYQVVIFMEKVTVDEIKKIELMIEGLEAKLVKEANSLTKEGLEIADRLVDNTVASLNKIGEKLESELVMAEEDIQKIEDIVPYHSDIVQAQPRCFCLDKRSVFPGHLYTIHPAYSSGTEFKGNSSCPSEEIQNLQVLKFIFVIQYIEKSLAGEIRSRTGLVALRRVNHLPFEPSTYNSHNKRTALK